MSDASTAMIASSTRCPVWDKPVFGMQSDRPVERQLLIVNGHRAVCVFEVKGSPDNGDDYRLGEVAEPKQALGTNVAVAARNSSDSVSSINCN